MIYIAFAFGIWFALVMVAGAAFRLSVPARLSALLSGPALALTAFVIALN